MNLALSHLDIQMQLKLIDFGAMNGTMTACEVFEAMSQVVERLKDEYEDRKEQEDRLEELQRAIDNFSLTPTQRDIQGLKELAK